MPSLKTDLSHLLHFIWVSPLAHSQQTFVPECCTFKLGLSIFNQLSHLPINKVCKQSYPQHIRPVGYLEVG